MEHPMYECKNCNKIFECRDRHRKAKFCSHSCYAESLRKKRYCLVCGLHIHWYQKYFCSWDCSGVFKQGKGLKETHKANLRGPRPHMREEKAYNYTGSTRARTTDMGRAEYRNWRRQVFERDDYTCQFCEERGGKLNADHIKPYSLFPELRYDIENGRTLCVECHKKTDTYMVKSRVYKKKEKIE